MLIKTIKSTIPVPEVQEVSVTVSNRQDGSYSQKQVKLTDSLVPTVLYSGYVMDHTHSGKIVAT